MALTILALLETSSCGQHKLFQRRNYTLSSTLPTLSESQWLTFSAVRKILPPDSFLRPSADHVLRQHALSSNFRNAPGRFRNEWVSKAE